MAVNLYDIAVINVVKSIESSMRKSVETGKAELHDKILFTLPDEANHGECPLCFLPMPLDNMKMAFYPCCSSYICNGCVYANQLINDSEKGLTCPFCREPAVDDEETRKRVMKRVKANDPAAMLQMGAERYEEGDYDGAVEYFSNAAELGSVDAHAKLGCMYEKGTGLRRTRRSTFIILRRLPLGVIPELDTILVVMRREMVMWREL